MTEQQTTTVIQPAELVGKVADYFAKGYRIVQICATKIPEHIELNYSFDKDYKFENLRLIIQQKDEVPSVSQVYWCAFAYENEINDLYGTNIQNINIDFKGKFYQTTVKAPFSKLEGAAVGAKKE